MNPQPDKLALEVHSNRFAATMETGIVVYQTADYGKWIESAFKDSDFEIGDFWRAWLAAMADKDLENRILTNFDSLVVDLPDLTGYDIPAAFVQSSPIYLYSQTTDFVPASTRRGESQAKQLYFNARGAWLAQALGAAILFTPQLRIVGDNPSENFYIYYKLASDTAKLNWSQPSSRFVFPQVDTGSLNVAEEPKTKSADKVALETIFNVHAKKWRDETRWSAVTMRRYAHPSYQAILVLGGKEPLEVTKLILKQMQKSPDMWFEALRRLNNLKDEPAKNAKTFEEATSSWLAWGIKEGLIS